MNFFIEHIGLPARAPGSLRDWYVVSLGATCFAPNGQAPPFFIRLPGAAMLLEIYPANNENSPVDDNALAGWRHVALRVESIETTRIEMESRGVSFLDPIKSAAGGGRVLFFKDGEGNLLHLVDRPVGSLVGR